MKNPLASLRHLPPGALLKKALLKCSRAMEVRLEELRARRLPREMTDAELEEALAPGTPIKEESRALFQPWDDHFWAVYASHYPEEIRETVEEARNIREHRLPLAGSDLHDLGEHIDWHRDPASRHRWDPLGYYKRIRGSGPDGADILNPWWLGSFYHLLPLAKTYRLAAVGAGNISKEEESRCLEEFGSQISSWIEQNPHPWGIGWNSTTIVSIRLVHWLWAWRLFGAGIPEQLRRRMLKQFLAHARHIRSNLEWFPVRTNHYLANLAALFFCGLLLPELKESGAWLAFSRAELQREMAHQVHPDGADHEGSLSYHRFAAEIFLAILALGKSHGLPFSRLYEERLEKMADLLLHALRPDGRLPCVGDASTIRLQNLDRREVGSDPRHLLALAAVLFNRGDFKQAAGAFPEYAFWLLGPEGRGRYERLPSLTAPPASRSFPQGGFHIVRRDGLYLLFLCGPLGLRGVRGHWHYDQLSFELFARGEPVLIDPGWLAYESDPAMMGRFKSTRSHNTVAVDGRDQVRDDLFLYPPPERPQPRLTKWQEGDRHYLAGEHRLYSRPGAPVIHRREILVAGSETVEVSDALEGSGLHSIEANLHFAPSVRVEVTSVGVRFRGQQACGTITLAGGGPGPWELRKGWAAPSYGHRAPTSVASLKWRSQLPMSMKIEIRLE